MGRYATVFATQKIEQFISDPKLDDLSTINSNLLSMSSETLSRLNRNELLERLILIAGTNRTPENVVLGGLYRAARRSQTQKELLSKLIKDYSSSVLDLAGLNYLVGIAFKKFGRTSSGYYFIDAQDGIAWEPNSGDPQSVHEIRGEFRRFSQ